MAGNIGRRIYGNCNGYFGPDDYETKVIIDETPTSICCKYVRKQLRDRYAVADFENERIKSNLIDEWEREGEPVDEDEEY